MIGGETVARSNDREDTQQSAKRLGKIWERSVVDDTVSVVDSFCPRRSCGVDCNPKHDHQKLDAGACGLSRILSARVELIVI